MTDLERLKDQVRQLAEFLTPLNLIPVGERGAIPVAMAIIEKLQAIANKVSKTADGIPVYHGMKVWLPTDREPLTVGVTAANERGPAGVGSCYSTQEAAEAAENTP